VQPDDRATFEDFFHAPPAIENYNKLSRANREYSDRILDIGGRVTFIIQDAQEGYGHAVWCAREFVGDEPFLLLLGDHLYRSGTDVSCACQMVESYCRFNRSVIGLKITPSREIGHYGCAAGIWEDPGSVLTLTEIVEKPDVEIARERLVMDGIEEDNFLAFFGQYVLKPRIFEYLGENIACNLRERGEFQLTSAIDRLRREDGLTGYIVKGRAFDIGNPEAYLRTAIEFATEGRPSL